MASKIKEQKSKIKAKIDAVKRIADDGEKSFNEKSNKFLKDLPTTDALFGKKLSDFAEKRKKKKENNKDIFGELIDTVEGFLGTNNKIEINEKSTNKQRLRQHTNDSINETLKSSKQIVMDSVKKVLFAGDGICGTNKSLVGSVTISPSEFDFMNVLTVSPVSNSGKIVYEDNKDRGLVKMNQLLYSGFTSPQTFYTKDPDPIFDITWNASTQKYTFDNFNVTKVDEFLTTYYTNIEFLDISGVTKTAMLMTLQGDGTEPPLFDKGFNDLNRLLAKLCALCNNPTSTGTNQNPTTEFNENDEDIEFYFDFDNVEGIDLDDESARYKKVLRFKDCNNFESVADTSHFEDFVYLSNKKNLNDAVNNALLNAAAAAHETSDSSIPPDNFHLSLLNTFILNLPKALIGSVLAPKYMLPIVIIYKSVVAGVGGLVESAKEIMKKLSKLFNEIIKNLLWKFISEFWKRVKIDLLNFLQKLALKILKNKAKRYYLIITSLIALLTKLLELGLDNCDSLFKIISQSIDLALKGGISSLAGGLTGGAQVPGFLLGLSHYLPGFSADRALLNITEKLESSGISTGPIFGESNNLTALVKSVIDGQTEEHDANSFIQVSTQEVIIPTPFGLPIIIPPGIITSSGKIF
jgi:hypothetical protein